MFNSKLLINHKARILVFLFLIVGVIPFITPTLSDQNGPNVEMTVSLVNVWVKAVDGAGANVKGLKSSDFEIFEDGKPVSIDCFEEIDNEGLSESQQPKMPAAGQKFVLYLDLLNTKSTDFVFIKPRLMEFLDQMAAKKYELMAIALLPSGKLVVISPFTNDISGLKEILNQAHANAVLVNEEKTKQNDLDSLLERLETEEPPIMSIDDLARDPVGLPNGQTAVRLKNTQTLKTAYALTENTINVEELHSDCSLSVG